MTLFQTLVLLVFASMFFVLAFVFYHNNRMFFKRENDIVKDGYNKLSVLVKPYKKYIKNWENRECLYYKIKMESSKPGIHQNTIFDEPNEILFVSKTDNICLNSNEITFLINYSKKKSIYIKNMKERFEFFQSKNASQIKKYYLSNTDTANNKPICNFFEFTIEENEQYFLIASFINKKLDRSKKIYLLDMNSKQANKIRFITFTISTPGLLLVFITLLMIFKT
ncbi:MAG: hypothetical protein OMM_01600 [Candidatus Magnetoglobus multicellularis str. Araruama]|uniref:Uncharacterized protein n=1 Tax=Candidatus Magnetoglobus multicellularis str. Araruama TaxID=890399 RepID=A0A1V1PD44_9BACT|nr:MAG: hypothetical protein OMM_01600 [Candidatus Magnetoglobus multicellularis str. Araruama]